jgi:hypothetical protein
MDKFSQTHDRMSDAIRRRVGAEWASAFPRMLELLHSSERSES